MLLVKQIYIAKKSYESFSIILHFIEMQSLNLLHWIDIYSFHIKVLPVSLKTVTSTLFTLAPWP